ncbi:MAG: prolipoprotein diacylglyceryl transferase [Armatimonadota bacterium]
MHPTLFTIGPLHVHSYGTLLMLGFLAGVALSWREARRLGLKPDTAIDLGVWALIAGVVGARVVFVAMNWRDYSAHPVEALYVWSEGGLSFHGGLLGGVVAALLFARHRSLSFWTIADMVTPGLALGYGIARFGCLLNGCCYGAPTQLPWGVRFPLYPDSEIATAPSHPTQIYSALGSFAILATLMVVRGRLRAPGQLFLLYLVLYAPLRAAVEVLRRGWTAQVTLDGVTQAQVVSAVIFVVALVWFVRRGRLARGGARSEARRA